jgi:hypothetical protein
VVAAEVLGLLVATEHQAFKVRVEPGFHLLSQALLLGVLVVALEMEDC